MLPLSSCFLHIIRSPSQTIRISKPSTIAWSASVSTCDQGIGRVITGRSSSTYISPLSFSPYGSSRTCRYIPGYLKELKIGHELELGLYKRQLYEVKDKMVCLSSFPLLIVLLMAR